MKSILLHETKKIVNENDYSRFQIKSILFKDICKNEEIKFTINSNEYVLNVNDTDYYDVDTIKSEFTNPLQCQFNNDIIMVIEILLYNDEKELENQTLIELLRRNAYLDFCTKNPKLKSCAIFLELEESAKKPQINKDMIEQMENPTPTSAASPRTTSSSNNTSSRNRKPVPPPLPPLPLTPPATSATSQKTVSTNVDNKNTQESNQTPKLANFIPLDSTSSASQNNAPLSNTDTNDNEESTPNFVYIFSFLIIFFIVFKIIIK